MFKNAKITDTYGFALSLYIVFFLLKFTKMFIWTSRQFILSKNKCIHFIIKNLFPPTSCILRFFTNANDRSRIEANQLVSVLCYRNLIKTSINICKPLSTSKLCSSKQMLILINLQSQGQSLRAGNYYLTGSDYTAF